jgi:hypothetical protein
MKYPSEKSSVPHTKFVQHIAEIVTIFIQKAMKDDASYDPYFALEKFSE